MQTKTKASRVDWAGLGWLILFFWYFSGVLQLLIWSFGLSVFVGPRQSFLVSLVWLVPVLAFPHYAKKIAGSLGVFLWLVSLPAFLYFLVYRQEFSQSVIFIMFESNLAEGTEYVQQYLSWWIVVALMAYTAGAYALWRNVRPITINSSAMRWAFVMFFAFSSVGYQALNQFFLKEQPFEDALVNYQKRLEPAAFWQLAIGYISYRQQLANMNEMLAANAAIPPLENLTDKTQGAPATLVLVIGESTNRQRMSLYGYQRPTTPRLDAMRDDLLVFNNVVTPIPYTIEALQLVLTFADLDSRTKDRTHPSLINLMEQAGYKSFWITNQQTLTARNTMLTMFSQQADVQIYLNNNREQNTRQYDSVVFEPFKAVLEDEAPRKFIVVHLLGTHIKYRYRYPEDYAVFTNKEGAPVYLDSDELVTYNEYDNAIHFNDMVVATLIETFAATDPNGLLLYFADHGDAVYDPEDPDMLGRSSASPTSDMYTVPMIAWMSPKWRENYPPQFDLSLFRPYTTDNLIYTWSDLAGLSYEGFDATKSVINPQFLVRPTFPDDPLKSSFALK